MREQIELTKEQNKQFIYNRTIKLNGEQMRLAGGSLDGYMAVKIGDTDIRLEASRKYRDIYREALKCESKERDKYIRTSLDEVDGTIEDTDIDYQTAFKGLEYRFISPDNVDVIENAIARGLTVAGDEYGVYFIFDNHGLISGVIDERIPFNVCVDKLSGMLTEDDGQAEDRYIMISSNDTGYARLYTAADRILVDTNGLMTKSFTEDGGEVIKGLGQTMYNEHGRIWDSPSHIQAPPFVSRRHYRLEGLERYIGVGDDGIIYNTKPMSAYSEQVEAINKDMREGLRKCNLEDHIGAARYFSMHSHALSHISSLPMTGWTVVLLDDAIQAASTGEDLPCRILKDTRDTYTQYHGKTYYIRYDRFKKMLESEGWITGDIKSIAINDDDSVVIDMNTMSKIVQRMVMEKWKLNFINGINGTRFGGRMK